MMEKVQVMDSAKQAIVDRVYANNQGHIFRFWNDISDVEKQELLTQVETVDFDLMKTLTDTLINAPPIDLSNTSFDVCDVIDIPKTSDEYSEEDRAKREGEKLLREGKMGVFLVAGGQGSRLGFEGPKGCFKISTVKNKPIFQLHAEYVKAMQKKYDTVIPWYIMTSDANHSDTKKFFEDNDYFGLNEVHMFKQGLMPAVDGSGKLLMKSKSSLFMNPDGHGGSISALKNSGAIEDMKKKGVEYLFYFQVDNILAKIADPTFLGHHVLNKSQMSSKTVEKCAPDEKVGVLGKIDGKVGVIEYTVIPENLASERLADGSLKFKAGSIGLHMFNVSFIDRLASEKLSLPFYKAHKKIAYIDESGQIVSPEAPNAYKFEKFIFDALAKTTNSVSMMVKREEEFAPVKNADGTDSPATAKALIRNLHASWLRSSGVDIASDANVEISWEYALDAEELLRKVKGQKEALNHNSEIYLGE